MIAAIVLAAGRASRMGANKLLVELDGEALVRHAVRAARAIGPVTVVTGHDAKDVRAALADLDVACVHNAAYATGMASSIAAGIAACAADADGALICLGDMPRVTSAHLARLVAAFAGPSSIVAPTCHGRRGNPVLWGRDHFAALAALAGDTGARALLATHAVTWIALDDPAILVDVDTPDALAALR